MRSLALGVAITDGHTRLTRLETDASLHAAFGTAAGRRIVTIIHFNISTTNAGEPLKIFGGFYPKLLSALTPQSRYTPRPHKIVNGAKK
jgi:hypothetical protein